MGDIKGGLLYIGKAINYSFLIVVFVSMWETLSAPTIEKFDSTYPRAALLKPAYSNYIL